ncbi:MAG: hypothetical protein RLZZ66_783 [Pseudomonadota bacterium]|jgi:hypothetical protein
MQQKALGPDAVCSVKLTLSTFILHNSQDILILVVITISF